MFILLYASFFACSPLKYNRDIAFDVYPKIYESEYTNDLIYFDFLFQSNENTMIVFDWTELYFSGAECDFFTTINAEKLGHSDLLKFKKCSGNAILLEDREGYFWSLQNLARYPVVGPYAGRRITEEMNATEPDTILIHANQPTSYHSPTFSNYILYPQKSSKSVRLYYFYTDINGSRKVFRSKWFDCKV